MSADSLAVRIEQELRVSPRTGVRVDERRRPGSATLASLTGLERVAWLGWLWVLFLVGVASKEKDRVR